MIDLTRVGLPTTTARARNYMYSSSKLSLELRFRSPSPADVGVAPSVMLGKALGGSVFLVLIGNSISNRQSSITE